MRSFEGDLKSIQELSQKSVNFSREISALEAESTRFQDDITVWDTRITTIDKKIAKAKSKLDSQLENEGFRCLATLGRANCSKEAQAIQAHIAELQETRNQYETSRDDTRDKLAVVDREVQCLQKRERGERCSLLELIPEIPDVNQLRSQMDAVDRKVEDFSKNIILLLTSIVLKSILIPLLFLYTLIQVTKYLWRRTINA